MLTYLNDKHTHGLHETNGTTLPFLSRSNQNKLSFLFFLFWIYYPEIKIQPSHIALHAFF